MIAWVSPKGLGDAIYLRAIVLHHLGQPQTVFTMWEDVFSNMRDVKVMPLSDVALEHDYNLRYAFYCLHCNMPELKNLSQFEMMCRQGGITESVELKIDWGVRNEALVKSVRDAAAGRPIMLVQVPKRPGNIEQKLIRPNTAAFVSAVRERDRFFRVIVGNRHFCDDIEECPRELDLLDKTSVTDILDLATAADTFLSDPCYLVVLAQAIGKPFECMFSADGLRSNYPKISGVTPERLFHRGSKGKALYDA